MNKSFPLAMPAHVIAIGNYLSGLPFTEESAETGKERRLQYKVTIQDSSGDRTLKQNSLAWKWHVEAATQIKDMSANEYRGYCKAYFGVPIMLEIDEYRELYNRFVKPHSVEDKLKLMELGYPVTSAMTVKQHTRYLHDCYVHYTSLGVVLTDPDEWGEKGLVED